MSNSVFELLISQFVFQLSPSVFLSVSKKSCFLIVFTAFRADLISQNDQKSKIDPN